MAFTTPASYTVGQLLTAALMNTYVRDNIRYLKGLDGPTAFSDAITVAGTIGSTGDITGPNVNASGSANAALTAQGTANASFARLSLIAKTSGGTAVDYRFLTNALGLGEWLVFDNAAGATRLYMNSSGNINIGTTAPLLPFQVAGGGIGKSGMWANSTTITTAQTILPAGAVTVGIVALGMVKFSGSGGIWVANTIPATGSNPMLSAGVAVSGSAFLYADSTATNVLSLSVSAGGAVTIARTAGTGTYDVSLMLFWR